MPGPYSFLFGGRDGDVIATADGAPVLLDEQQPDVFPPRPARSLPEVLREIVEIWNDAVNRANEPAISLRKVDELVDSHIVIQDDYAAGIAVLKAYVLQDPGHLNNVGRFANLFQISSQDRLLGRSGIDAFAFALRARILVDLWDDARRAHELEQTYQEMLDKLRRRRAVANATRAAPAARSLLPLWPVWPGVLDFNTIRQGQAGDCAFFSALIGYLNARQGTLLLRRIEELPPVGPMRIRMFSVVFFAGVGVPFAAPVIVDEPTLPEYALYGYTTDHSLWVPVLEKAYLRRWRRTLHEIQQLAGHYVSLYDAAVNGESISQAITNLTGVPQWRELQTFGWMLDAVSDALLWLILRSANFGQIVLVGTKPRELLSPPNRGIVPETHAMAVLHVDEQERTIHLLNPWNLRGIPNGSHFDVTIVQFREMIYSICATVP